MTRRERIQREHDRFLRSHGIDPDRSPELTGAVERIGEPPSLAAPVVPLGDTVPATSPRRDRLDALALSREDDGTREGMLRRAARTAPKWNKGGYMYVSDNADMVNGRRV